MWNLAPAFDPSSPVEAVGSSGATLRNHWLIQPPKLSVEHRGNGDQFNPQPTGRTKLAVSVISEAQKRKYMFWLNGTKSKRLLIGRLPGQAAGESLHLARSAILCLPVSSGEQLRCGQVSARGLPHASR